MLSGMEAVPKSVYGRNSGSFGTIFKVSGIWTLLLKKSIVD